MSRPLDPQHESRVRALLDRYAPCGGWRIRPLGSGRQAQVFLARRRATPDARPAQVVVKLYTQTIEGFDVAHEQEAAFTHLHNSIDGRVAHGWRLRVPRPLARFDDPAALLTTRVPGRPLSDFLRRGRLRDADSIVAAILVALRAMWSSKDRFYGDLNFDNVLCHPRRRVLSFVDPGIAEPQTWCNGLPRRFFPASCDLGYNLFHSASSLKTHLLHPLAWRRRMRLSEVLLRQYCRGLASEAQRRDFLDDVNAVCQALVRDIRTPASPRGAWRLMVRGAARLQIACVMRHLRAVPVAQQPHVVPEAHP